MAKWNRNPQFITLHDDGSPIPWPPDPGAQTPARRFWRLWALRRLLERASRRIKRAPARKLAALAVAGLLFAGRPTPPAQAASTPHFVPLVNTPAFAPAQSNPFNLAAVGAHSSPSWGDLDGDGDLDAFVGNSAGNTLFFENTGSAIASAFAAAQTNPFGLADVGSRINPSWADLDGDGDLDAFVGNHLGLTIFFENTGSVSAPAFAAAQTNPYNLADVGTYSSPSWADLDGDGDLDAFVGNFDGNTIFFENTGSATAPAFAAAQTNPYGLPDVGFYSSPSWADLDGDGDLDAFVGNIDGNTLFFENTGSATSPAFTAAQTNPYGLSDVGNKSRPSWADLDGDGDLDAFVGEIYGNTIFFENTGSRLPAAFSSPQSNPHGLTDVGYLSSPSWADLDGDGDLDAFMGNDGGYTIFFKNTGSATAPAFAAAQTNPYGLTDVGYLLSTPSWADLDGDGDLDAFVGKNSGNTLFLENTGSATAPAFAAAITNPFGLADVGNRSRPSWADLDGDGDLDAFMGEYDGGNTIFFENTGSATAPAFAAAQPNPYGLSDVGIWSSPSWADLDGDGDLDAFMGEYDGNTIFFENTGSATSPAFAAAQTNPLGLVDVGYTSSPSWADLDGDGDLDAFMGEYNGNTIFFENVDSGTPNPFGLVDVGFTSSPSWADLDGDGDLDAFVGESGGNTIIFENTGSVTMPEFAAAQTNPFGLADVGGRSSPSWADLDGDGDLDAFVGEYFGNIIFFENTGSSTAPAFAAAQTNPYNLADVGSNSNPSWADLDGDGDLDAFVGENGGITNFFKNTGSATAPAFAAAQSNPYGLSDVGVYSSPSWADLDGDGDLDAFVGERFGNTIIFENSGSATAPDFAAPQSNPFGLNGIGNLSSPSWADLDGDGDLDAFVGDSSGNTYFFENTGSRLPAAFAAAQTNPDGLANVGSYSSPSWADLDGDGDLDAFVGNSAGNTLFFENTGSAAAPAFAAAQTNSFGLSDVGGWSKPSWADLDGDGDLDAFVGNDFGKTIFFENTGSAVVPAFAAAQSNPYGLSDVGYMRSPSWADLDGDGDLDAFMGNESGNTIFFENTGSATAPAFAAAQPNPYGLSDVGNWSSPSWADLDGDGDLDAFVGELYERTFFFENTGSATSPAFAAAQSNPLGLKDVGFANSPSWADLDGDGDLDAFMGEYYGDILAFENKIGHAIPLSAGWNMISLFLEPLTPLVSDVLAGIQSDMVLIKNGAGEIYWPDYNVNQTGSWAGGYQIYMQNPANLVVFGSLIDPQPPIALDAGWNLVAYTRISPMPIGTALSGIRGNLLLVKDGDGNVYWPAEGINTIGDMQPGMGYQIFMNNAANLTYPVN